MRLASNDDRIHGAGAEVVAISVDDEGRAAAMAQRWGFSHIRFVSDPGGERYLQPLGLFDPEERGGIALPGILLIDPSGREVYRYQGRDFADRTTDDELFEHLDQLDLPAVEPEPWVPDAAADDEARGAFPPSDLGAYFRGNMFAAVAIGGRAGDDPAAKAAAREHRQMSKATLDAWKAWQAKIG